MTNLERPGSSSLRGLGDVENAESSEAEPQFSTPNARLEALEEPREELSCFDGICWEELASEDDLAAPIDPLSSHPPQRTRNDLRRKAAISNHKGVHFKRRNKKFVARLCLPGGKSRKLELGEYNTHDEAARAYQVGAFYYNKSSTSNSGEDTYFLDALPCVPYNLSDAQRLAWVRDRARDSAATIGTSERPHTSASKSVLGSGCSSFDGRPSTPVRGTDDTTIDRHKRKSAAPHNSSEITGFERPNKVQTHLNTQTPVAGHQAVSQVKMTDSIIFALCELRQQGWKYTLKSRSPSSVGADVLFSVPQGQHAAPALLITDIITNSFHELREQGWEVHLQPHGGGNAESRSEICLTATGSAAQDKLESEFPASTLRIGSWRRESGHDGVQVTVKFSYSQQKLKWKVLESGRKRKIEIHWSDIVTMKATYEETRADYLMIRVSSTPLFFEDTSPQPMMYTSWQACTDFTGGKASWFKLHLLQFHKGVLEEHYEKLVHYDPRLKAADARGVHFHLD